MADLYLFLSPHVNVQAMAIAGALFNEAGTIPFLGVRLLVGCYIELPRPHRAQEDYGDSEDFD